MVQDLKAITADTAPKELKYTPDRRLRTDGAANRAIKIVNGLNKVNDPCLDPDETSLFAALQTCAYRAARSDRGERISHGDRRQ